MKYLVTGSAGFIGSHVSERLLEQGHEVLGVDAFTDYYDPALKRARAARLAEHPGYRHVAQDLMQAELETMVDGRDAVIHLAAQPGVRLSWNHFGAYVDRNLLASQRLLEAVRRTAVPRLVLASSSSVYGNVETYPTTEKTPPRPFSPYGVTKLAMEHLAWSYADNWGVSVAALRYFTVYGPGQRPDMAFHKFIEHAGRGEPIDVYGDGEQVRDFTYVSDVVEATIAAAGAELSGSMAFNVAGGSSTTVNQVLALVEQCVGRPVHRRQLPEQPGDVRITGGTTERARSVLGWQPLVPLQEGIRRQVEHQLAQRVPPP